MLIEILGWTGSLLVLIAYALVMNKKMLPDSAAYYGLNIAGSCFLIVHTAVHHAFPSMLVNIVWVLIPVITIIRSRSNGKSPS